CRDLAIEIDRGDLQFGDRRQRRRSGQPAMRAALDRAFALDLLDQPLEGDAVGGMNLELARDLALADGGWAAGDEFEDRLACRQIFANTLDHRVRPISSLCRPMMPSSWPSSWPWGARRVWRPWPSAPPPSLPSPPACRACSCASCPWPPAP